MIKMSARQRISAKSSSDALSLALPSSIHRLAFSFLHADELEPLFLTSKTMAEQVTQFLQSARVLRGTLTIRPPHRALVAAKIRRHCRLLNDFDVSPDVQSFEYVHDKYRIRKRFLLALIKANQGSLRSVSRDCLESFCHEDVSLALLQCPHLERLALFDWSTLRSGTSVAARLSSSQLPSLTSLEIGSNDSTGADPRALTQLFNVKGVICSCCVV